jgi:hypothetical protein
MKRVTELTERHKLAYERRKAGATFKQIGMELGVGIQRARDIYHRALRVMGKPIPQPKGNQKLVTVKGHWRNDRFKGAIWIEPFEIFTYTRNRGIRE